MTADPASLTESYRILLIAVLIFINGVITAMNTAMESANRTKIRQMTEEDQENHRAQTLYRLVQQPAKYRNANRLLNYVFVVFGLLLTIGLPYNRALCVLVYLVALLSLGEICPRKIGKQHSLGMALRMAGFQYFVYGVFFPVTWTLTVIANLVLRLLRQKTNVDEKEYSEDDVMSILEAGQQSGEIREEGRKMIGSIFQFDDELAYEIMTPRTDVFMIDITDPPEEYLDQLMKMRYTRMPVCDGGSDDIIGILHIKDYLIKAWQTGFDQVDIREILRKPYLVPETKKIDTLFVELQREKQHIAVLIDEYGGFSGIVTLEDIIEEIVGDIDDEYDEEEESIEKINDTDYLIDGSVDLDDLNEELGTDLESENSETIGGYLIDMIGEIPNDGYINQTIRVENYDFTILSVKERRIERIRLHIDEPDTEEIGERGEHGNRGEERS